jgi:hypothetical protein
MLLSIGKFLVDILSAKVSANNTRKLLSYLRDRLGSKPIELTIEIDGKKLQIKASSREEFEMAIQKAQEFVDQDFHP